MESRPLRGGGLAALSGVVSLIAAGSCCLPLGTILVAAGFAGLSAMIESLRPWLVGVSVAALAAGFWQAYGRKRCAAHRSRFSVALLWGALVLMAGFVLFPQAIAGVLADVVSR